MEKKREMKEITLKAKLMKLEPKIELAKQYDEYVSNRITQPQPQPEQEEEIIEVQKPKPKPKKKIIYQEVEEEEEEEEIVYVKKNKPKPQESLNSTLYKSSQETLFDRAIEELNRANLTGFYSAMLPREY
jgi:hypothetical protein